MDRNHPDCRVTKEDDVCVCGDYRSNHKDSYGPCEHNKSAGGLGHGGAPDCEQFRFSMTFVEEQEIYGK